METLVFFSDVDPFPPWREALSAALPDVAILTADEVRDPAAVLYALVWKPPLGFFERFPNLQLVTILGAGADALLRRRDLPNVPIARLSDPAMARMMAGYVLFAVLRYARDIPQFEAAQRQGRWHYVHPRAADEIKVGVLGLGELGGVAAVALARQGFDVRGWARSAKAISGVRTSAGRAALPAFLAGLDIAVVMLPSTPETDGLIDADHLRMLPRGAALINVSRGSIVDEAALLAALRSGHLSGATLDVFAHEPLPADHPFWAMTTVLVTPHLASVAVPGSASAQIADNVCRVRSGLAPQHRVDPARGY